MILLLQVNTNGAISFQIAVSQYTPDPFPLNGSRALIAPFWADVDTTGTGDVWYHKSTNTTLLIEPVLKLEMPFLLKQLQALLLQICLLLHGIELDILIVTLIW